MYTLFRWKPLLAILTLPVVVYVYIDDLLGFYGVTIPSVIIASMLAKGFLVLIICFFAPTGYWAPWRFLWRLIPRLNSWFPDLNGIWVGSTSSNWPTIEMLVDTAQSKKQVTEDELYDHPDQKDAMAIQITNNVFMLCIKAGLSSTNGESHSITARPWQHQHTKRIHISYVYQQSTPNPASTDQEEHFGFADLELVDDDFSNAEGTYWTRRAWRTGRNTAGKLYLRRLQSQKTKGKSLKEYAAEQKRNGLGK